MEGVHYLDRLFAEAPEFIVTSLFMGPVCLLARASLKSQSDLSNNPSYPKITKRFTTWIRHC